jgi:hypothetical protein
MFRTVTHIIRFCDLDAKSPEMTEGAIGGDRAIGCGAGAN